MTTTTPSSSTTIPSWQMWTGRILSGLLTLMMLASATGKLSHAPQMVEMFTGRFGFRESSLTPIGVLEIACALSYAVPRTSVLGAGLLSAYLGGAVATHVRVGDPFIAPVVLGLIAWVGLYLRDERIRALLPLRRPS